MRLPVWGFVSDGYTDEQLYALIGHEMNNGLWPYVDLWDRKPIGLFLIFAFADLLPLPAPQNYQLMGGIFTFAGAFLLYLIARRIVGHIVSVGAGLLYVLGLYYFGSGSGQSETFHVPMMIAMAWLLIPFESEKYFGRALAAMVIGGLALQVKYTVFPQCVFFGSVALWKLHRQGFTITRLVASATAFAALGLAPTFAAMATYWVAGYFQEFWFANVESSLLRESFGRLVPGILRTMLVIVLFALGGLYLSKRRELGRRPAFIMNFAFGWLLAAIATTMVPGTLYGYYLGAIVPAAAILSLPLLELGRNFVLGAVVVYALFKINPIGGWEEAQGTRIGTERIASAIRPHVDPESNCLWVLDGRTSYYQDTNSCLPTRFIYPDHLNNSLERGSLPVPQLPEVQRILANKPAIIVDADLGFTKRSDDVMTLVRRTLEDDYVKLEEVKVRGRVLSVWKLKEITD